MEKPKHFLENYHILPPFVGHLRWLFDDLFGEVTSWWILAVIISIWFHMRISPARHDGTPQYRWMIYKGKSHRSIAGWWTGVPRHDETETRICGTSCETLKMFLWSLHFQCDQPVYFVFHLIACYIGSKLWDVWGCWRMESLNDNVQEVGLFGIWPVFNHLLRRTPIHLTPADHLPFSWMDILWYCMMLP